ncbi:MAG: sigma-54-dependent Fis family transcriptional regulator [Bacteriovoracaceae bacterium]|nr:sigma-54-dependent Fis family transcriptional regulator [Bacteriovoracaceae bacterium]
MDTVNVELFGKDPRIQKAINTAKNVSVTKASVLIVGEVGIGKKTLCRFIHQNSNRKDRPFEVVDCSLEKIDVENALLGHREESTGKFYKGALESANGGSVVLANIDSMDEVLQKKLHKILNELEDYDIDIRIIATTTKNLSKLVGSGRFYRGLYTHISRNAITMCSLRERQGDLEMLIRYYVNEYNEKFNKTIVIDKSAINKMLGHYWTHNVEELKSVLQSAVENCTTNILNEEILGVGEKKSESSLSYEENEGIRLMSLKEAEKLLIKKALIFTSENRTQAAKILGVSIRTLRNKINEYRNIGSPYFINLR